MMKVHGLAKGNDDEDPNIKTGRGWWDTKVVLDDCTWCDTYAGLKSGGST